MLFSHKASKEGFEQETEKLIFEASDISLNSYENDDKLENGSGKLVLSSERLYWRADVPKENCLGSLSLKWSDISLHAIENENDSSCIFSMVDFDSDNEESPEIFLRFYPKDKTIISKIYDNFSLCAKMNPDTILEEELDSEAFTIADIKKDNE